MIEANFKTLPAILKRRNWIILGFLLTFSLPFLSWRFSLGVLIGGLVANFNFYLLHRHLIKALIFKKTERGFIPKSMLRLFITGLLVFIVLLKDWVNVFGLILGLSVVVINLIFLALIEAKELILSRR
jgi:hypothetical protein